MSVSDLINAFETIPKLTLDKTPPSDSTGLQDTPNWLTKSYLQDSLRKHYGDAKLRITALDDRPALGRGENYGGVLTRIKLQFTRQDGSTQKGHYIVKTSYEADETARKIMEPYDIFNREMGIYEQILPKLNALLLEIEDDEQLFAETLAVDYDRSALIFEDLNVRGFVMADRLAGLDMKLARLVLRKMAKMHATTAVLNERESGILEGYDRGMFNRHTQNYAPGFVGLLEACSRRVAQWKGYEAYAVKLAALVPAYMELAARVFDATQGHVNVLCHGDLWTNNVLVKYDKETGEAEDVILIDFQYCAWGSPAIDLFYFLNSSLEQDLHLQRQEELIEYYFSIFSEMLHKLRYKAHIPSLRQFLLQLQQKEFYSVHTSLTVLPIHRNEETADADFNAIMQNNERAIRFKDGCFANPKCHRIIRELLPVYEQKGLLDADQ